MNGSRRALLAALVLAGLPSCAALTFSHAGAVDFGRFRVVRVAVRSEAHAAYGQQYLVAELEASSGFERVTTDLRERVDLVLELELGVFQEISVDDDGNTDVEYQASVSFVATTPEGAGVDAGSADARSETALEAVEDVLDWVGHHYLAPYRA